MFKTKIRIRYSDAFQTGQINIHSILELFQDVGYFESEDLGYGEKTIREAGNAWFLLAWHLDIRELPEANEYVILTTQPYKMKGFFAYRRYQILNEQEECMVMGDALWIYMNYHKMIPQRISKDVENAYIPAPLDIKPIVKRKLNDQGDWGFLQECKIPMQLIDTNGHLNNTNYITLIYDYMKPSVEISSVNIEYRQAAKPEETVSIYQCYEEDKQRFLIRNEDKEVCCIIEYI